MNRLPASSRINLYHPERPSQCPKRRIPAFQTMHHEIACWVRKRDEIAIGIDWQFTTESKREVPVLMVIANDTFALYN